MGYVLVISRWKVNGTFTTCMLRQGKVLLSLIAMMMGAGSILEFVERVQRSTGRKSGVKGAVIEIYIYLVYSVLHVMKYASTSTICASC
jgi:hypothetical protein